MGSTYQAMITIQVLRVVAVEKRAFHRQPLFGKLFPYHIIFNTFELQKKGAGHDIPPIENVTSMTGTNRRQNNTRSGATDTNRNTNKKVNQTFEFLDYIKLWTHNLNGIKGDSQKLINLTMEAQEQGVTMIGLCETNIGAKAGRGLNAHLRSKDIYYTGFWSTAHVSKSKGSGVAILINNKWEKYVSKVEFIHPQYALELTLKFKQATIKITQVYLPYGWLGPS